LNPSGPAIALKKGQKCAPCRHVDMEAVSAIWNGLSDVPGVPHDRQRPQYPRKRPPRPAGRHLCCGRGRDIARTDALVHAGAMPFPYNLDRARLPGQRRFGRYLRGHGGWVPHRLGEAGYVEGRNVTVEYHHPEGQYDRLPLSCHRQAVHLR
jgi:hypothetical protein